MSEPPSKRPKHSLNVCLPPCSIPPSSKTITVTDHQNKTWHYEMGEAKPKSSGVKNAGHSSRIDEKHNVMDLTELSSDDDDDDCIDVTPLSAVFISHTLNVFYENAKVSINSHEISKISLKIKLSFSEHSMYYLSINVNCYEHCFIVCLS